MSGSVNRAFIIGNLGSDPEVRTTATGQMVATLSVATSESFTDKQGQRQDRTEWHKVVLWGKTAEVAQRWLAKGRKVYVEGRIQTRSWDDPQTGAKRYATEIVASQLTLLDSPTQGRSQEGQRGADWGHGGAGAGSTAQGPGRGSSSTPPLAGWPEPEFSDDPSVPF